MPFIHGKSMHSTSRYKNNKALKAWLWVELDTLRSVANMVIATDPDGNQILVDQHR